MLLLPAPCFSLGAGEVEDRILQKQVLFYSSFWSTCKVGVTGSCGSSVLRAHVGPSPCRLREEPST